MFGLYAGYSNQVALTITFTDGSTYEHDRNIWSDICSSAYQVKQGGYLIDYATAYGRTRAKLVGLDVNGNTAFDDEYPTTDCGTIFIARPIDFGALQLD